LRRAWFAEFALRGELPDRESLTQQHPFHTRTAAHGRMYFHNMEQSPREGGKPGSPAGYDSDW
jgi:hypothetical protein